MDGNCGRPQADIIVHNNSLRRPIRVSSPSRYGVAGNETEAAGSDYKRSLFKIKIHKRALSESILLCREQQDDRQEDLGLDCFHSLLRFVCESS